MLKHLQNRISNELRPGDISSLAQSEDLVGRVYFKEVCQNLRVDNGDYLF